MVHLEGEADLLEVVGELRGRRPGATFCTAGSKRPIRTAMIAMTTSSSIRVIAARLGPRSTVILNP